MSFNLKTAVDTSYSHAHNTHPCAAPTLHPNSLSNCQGDLDAAGQRTSPACKVAYPNRDTFFGPYAAGAKAGTGLYVAASGAAYVGQYAGGKRCGFGLMVLPDGGLYKGGFKDDRFEGQVRW